MAGIDRMLRRPAAPAAHRRHSEIASELRKHPKHGVKCKYWWTLGLGYCQECPL